MSLWFTAIKTGAITIKANGAARTFENIVRLKARQEGSRLLWTLDSDSRVFTISFRFVSVRADARDSKSDENHCATG